MSQQRTISTFIIQSKFDNEQFTVDKKVIESSTLLKNICDITNITEPIIVSCPSQSLQVYINLINNYDTLEIHDEEFEKNFFDKFTSNDKQKLIQLIQDLCILDSDLFLDSAADYILGILEENIMDWNEIQEYLGLENDFSQSERKLLEKEERGKYFLSIDTETFKFPFSHKSLYSLKTDFSTPMNALIARIVQRSNETISYLLSLINKTIKNEVDRHPIKLTKFKGCSRELFLEIPFENVNKRFFFQLDYEDSDEKYFNVLKKRKIIAEKFSLWFEGEQLKHSFFEYNSPDFPISKHVKVSFSKTYKAMYQFDITKVYSSSIFYDFICVKEEEINFEEVYNHLIAKDLSKKIKLFICDSFGFTCGSCFLIYKKPNASKFYKINIYDGRNFYSEFKEFISYYMEEDGIIQSKNVITQIPMQISKEKEYYNYPVSAFKRYVEFISI